MLKSDINKDIYVDSHTELKGSTLKRVYKFLRISVL